MSVTVSAAPAKTLEEFHLNLAPAKLTASVVRSADGAIHARVQYGGQQLVLTRSNVAALREMLARCQRAMLEAEWET